MSGIDIKARVGGVWRDETLGGSPPRAVLLVVAAPPVVARVHQALRRAHLEGAWSLRSVDECGLEGLPDARAALIEPDHPLASRVIPLLAARNLPWIALGDEHVAGALGCLPVSPLEPQGLAWALRHSTERRAPDSDDHTFRMLLAGEVAASVAHEINNPLTYLLTNLEHVELAARDLPASLRDAVVEARQGAERLAFVVAELGRITRPPGKRLKPVYVDRMLESVLTMARPHLQDRARPRLKCEALHPVTANEARLFQVLLNLVINAAQAIEPGEPDANEVLAGTRWSQGRHVEIFVQDTGVGIAPDLLQRVFEPFFTTKGGGSGTGLGLALCRRYIEEMGGTIAVESHPGAGSSFTIRLPVARGADRPTLVPDLHNQPASILIVDDERLIGRAYARALGGHRVVVAHSVDEALERLGEQPFDVVFTDVLMPEQTGLDLYRIVAARWPDLTGKVVFLSGGALDERSAAFLEQLENPRFQKPVGAQQLRDIVAAMLRQR